MSQFATLVIYYCIRHYNIRTSEWVFKRKILQKIHDITRADAVNIMRKLQKDCTKENDSFYEVYDAEFVIVDQLVEL